MTEAARSGLVTLTTDFGRLDPYVGIMKGVLFSRARSLRAVIDLSHDVAPRDVRAASFYLAHAWRWFPAGTVHVAVVDPGVGSARAILLAREAGHLFLAPDNGLLAPVLGPEAEVWSLDVERFALPGASRTFHGRDVFSPAAAALLDGLAPEAAGTRAERPSGKGFPAPSGARGEVLLADRFGNLITNLPASAALGHSFARVAGRSVPLRGTYAEASRGELLALVDSYGLVEVAQRDGSAAAALDLGPGAPVELRKTP